MGLLVNFVFELLLSLLADTVLTIPNKRSIMLLTLGLLLLCVTLMLVMAYGADRKEEYWFTHYSSAIDVGNDQESGTFYYTMVKRAN